MLKLVDAADMLPETKVHFLSGERQFFSRRLPESLALELNRLLADQYQEGSRVPQAVGSIDPLEQRIRKLQQQWPQCVDPHIALFKLYFRTAQYAQAEKEVWLAMKLLSSRQKFKCNYRLLQVGDMDWLENDSDQRQFLFCLKALGVIRLRRGKILLAKTVLDKLAQLDPYDEIGGASYWQIALSFDEQ
jgi:tetratricopeptide (TPR) repeat protein